MKLIILIIICIISPILGEQEQEQDQEELDYYDTDVLFDVPVLRPSEFTIEELVDPNFHIDPESTLTFNYDKVINGQNPEPVEKRKESVKHYLRVRKPTTKRVIYHIKPNKADEYNILPTPAYNLANVEKEIVISENARSAIPDQNEEKQTIIPVKSPLTPTDQNENGNNGINRISETTQTIVKEADLTIPSNDQTQITKGDIKISEIPIAVPEKQEIISDISSTTKVPRFRMRSNQKVWKNIQSRTTQSVLETSAPTSTTKTTFAVSNNMRTGVRRKFENSSVQKRGQGRKWLQSTTTPITTTEDVSSTTPYYTNKPVPVPRTRFHLRKWPAVARISTTTLPEPLTPLFMEQQSTKHSSLQQIETDAIISDKSKKNKNGSVPNENTTSATLLSGTNVPSDNNSIAPNKLRIVRRKFQKLTSPEKLNWPVRRNRILSSLEASNLLQNAEQGKISPDSAPVTEVNQVTTIEPTTTEATAQETTIPEATTTTETTTTELTTVPPKKRRNFGRKRLRLRLRTTTPTSTPEGNTVNLSVNTDVQTISDLDNTTKSPRMRNRNRFRKVKAQKPEVKEVTVSTDEIVISSSTLPSMTTSTQVSSSAETNINDEIFMDTSENPKSILQEKPKSRFSKDNPPPPVPTLSPWFDGFGK